MFLPHNDSDILDAGDIESMPFIEALGQFSYRVGKETVNFCNVFLVLLMFLLKDGDPMSICY
jgi:CTP synthase